MDTSNNANVIKVTSLGHLSGLSYGQYVAAHDTSKYAVKKKEDAKLICRKCGKPFNSFGHKKRRVCDKCKEEAVRAYNREREAQKRAAQEKG